MEIRKKTISFSAKGFQPNFWNLSQSQTYGVLTQNPFEAIVEQEDNNNNPWEGNKEEGGVEVNYSGFEFINGDSLQLNKGEFSGNFGEFDIQDGKQHNDGQDNQIVASQNEQHQRMTDDFDVYQKINNDNPFDTIQDELSRQIKGAENGLLYQSKSSQQVQTNRKQNDYNSKEVFNTFGIPKGDKKVPSQTQKQVISSDKITESEFSFQPAGNYWNGKQHAEHNIEFNRSPKWNGEQLQNESQSNPQQYTYHEQSQEDQVLKDLKLQNNQQSSTENANNITQPQESNSKLTQIDKVLFSDKIKYNLSEAFSDGSLFRQSLIEFSDITKSDISGQEFQMFNSIIQSKEYRGTLHPFHNEIFQVLQDYNITQQIVKRFKLANLKSKALLIQNSDFQIGVISDRVIDTISQRYLIKTDIFLRNKTHYPIRNFTLDFESDYTSNIYFKNDIFPEVIEGYKQVKIQCVMSYTRTPFSLVNGNVTGIINDKEIEFSLFLPNLLPRYLHFNECYKQIQVLRNPTYFKRYFPEFTENMTINEFIFHNKTYPEAPISYKLRGVVELDIPGVQHKVKIIIRPNYTFVIQVIPFSGFINTAETLIDHLIFLFGKQ